MDRNQKPTGKHADLFHCGKVQSPGALTGAGGSARHSIKSRELLEKIVSLLPVGVSYVEDGRLKWSNQTMCEMFGHKHESEYLNRHIREFYATPDEYRRVVSVLFEKLQHSFTVETEALFRRSDGSTFSGYLRINSPDPSDPWRGTITAILDISEQKLAEKKLRESEERYRLITYNSLTGIYIHQDGRFIYVNDRLAEILGFSPEELVGRHFWELVHPADRELVTRRGLARSKGEEVPGHYEFRSLTKSGQTKWVEVQATTITYHDRPANMGNIIDITERKLADQALKESEERYRSLVEESFDGVFLQKGNRIVFANKRLHEMLYCKEGDLEGIEHWLIYDLDYREMAKFKAESILNGQFASQRYEGKLRRLDGSLFDAEISARGVRVGQGSGIQTWIRDVTDQKRAEQELIKIEKLRSTGVLAGGIAHDFNNILTAIMGNISLAKMNMDRDSKAFERIQSAERAAMRAQSLTHQLLTFAKGGEPIKKTVVLTDVVRDSVEFALGGSNVGYEISAPASLWPVEVDPGQISQVINNLVINADQAMPGGGVVKIELRNVVLGPEERPPHDTDRYVRISVSDEGTGIPPEHLPRVFDAYFTTKEKGSGLGLATAFSIVKNHGGDIRVESTPGEGTTFEIYLPAALCNADDRSDSEELVQGKGRILLMDDEETIREVAGELLTMLGYSVEFARDGAEAVAMYNSVLDTPQCFDAVIMDLTVPGGMGGKEAVREILALDPKAKVIVSSGYSNDPVMAEYSTHGFSGVVKKPYTAEELSRKLFELLSNADSPRAGDPGGEVSPHS